MTYDVEKLQRLEARVRQRLYATNFGSHWYNIWSALLQRIVERLEDLL